jgi:hypothetical protein|tara:strand:- start:351 stop:590 length:240 start_codon:yes stop_codon:yes gene_type:complete
MAFEVKKMGKLADMLEERAYDWVFQDVQETYGVDSLEDLTEDMIEEMQDYLNGEEWIEGYVVMVLQTIIDGWEGESQDG